MSTYLHDVFRSAIGPSSPSTTSIPSASAPLCDGIWWVASVKFIVPGPPVLAPESNPVNPKPFEAAPTKGVGILLLSRRPRQPSLPTVLDLLDHDIVKGPEEATLLAACDMRPEVRCRLEHLDKTPHLLETEASHIARIWQNRITFYSVGWFYSTVV